VFKNKVWEIKEGGAKAISNAPTLTVTKVAEGATPPSLGKNAQDKVEDEKEIKRADAASPRKRHGHAASAEGPVETLTYRDPFGGVYKK
jgi:nitrite reductase (NAD(P)H)